MNEPSPDHLRRKSPRGCPASGNAFVSNRPWAGFTAHDSPRPEPLPRCPNARCRRAKACIAALDNLYCLRTHHSLAEQQRLRAASELTRELQFVPEVTDKDSLTERAERIAAFAEIRRSHDARMLAKWRAGEFDKRFGPWRRDGVVMKPPPRSYVEDP
jgi:hypothetical protein